MEHKKQSIIAVLAFLAGYFFIKYLIVDPAIMNYFLVITILLAVGIVFFLTRFSKKRNLCISVISLSVLFLCGYALATNQMMNMPEEENAPLLTRSTEDPGKGHTAVIYISHGEPVTYDPIVWINQFKELEETGVPFVPHLIRPIFINHLRRSYMTAGESHHCSIHNEMFNELEKAYREEGDSQTKFYLSFLDEWDTPAEATIKALNEGASKIIICNVFLTQSNHSLEGEHQVKEILDEFDIPVYQAGPFWDSQTLKSMFVNRLNAHVGNIDKTDIGVLLVGHGQPDEWDKEFPTETEQELSFRYDIIDLFINEGYNKEHLSLAWMEFKAPKVEGKIKEFVNKKLQKVYYFPAAISADCIHTQIDLPEQIARVDIPSDMEIVNLGGWNNDPIVVKAIKEKVDVCMGQKEESLLSMLY